MKCPKCGAAAPDGADECPSCGLLFSRWKELKERERREAEEALARLEAPAPEAARGDPRKTRLLISAALILAWLSIFGVYYHLRLRRLRRSLAPAEEAPVVSYRDPKTGDLVRLKVQRGPAPADAPRRPWAAPPAPSAPAAAPSPSRWPPPAPPPSDG